MILDDLLAARDRRGRLLLSRRHRRPAALPRPADPPACADQGRQSRPRPRRAGPAAAGRLAARRAQADRRLAAGAAGRRHGRPAYRARRAARPDHRHEPGVRCRSWSRLVLGVAGWTIAAREAFAAVVGFVAYGLLLALVWVRLAAPDVALTEAAIGGGVTGVLLLGAAARLRGVAAAPDDRPAAPLRARRRRCSAPRSLRRSRPSCCCCPTPPRRWRRRRWRACRRPASAIPSPAS